MLPSDEGARVALNNAQAALRIAQAEFGDMDASTDSHVIERHSDNRENLLRLYIKSINIASYGRHHGQQER